MNSDAPASPDTLLLEAHAAFEEGRLPAAEANCRRLLERVPDHADALTLLGIVLLSRERHDEAEAIFERLCALQPEESAHWSNLGTARRGLKRYDASLAAYAKAAALGESGADFCFNVGLTHFERLDFEAARALFKDALRLAPDDAEIRFHLAQCHSNCLEHDAALEVLQPWPSGSEVPDELCARVAHLLMNLGEHARAEAAARRGAAGPQGQEATLALIEILERSNRVAEAAEHLARLQQDPAAADLGNDLKMAAARVAQREGRNEQALELFGELQRSEQPLPDRHQVLFPMAQALDALKRHDEAFATLRLAHQSQVAHVGLAYPLAGLRGTPQLKVTQLRCDPADVARWDQRAAPPMAASPIFIVAFPRSGTTLLELALDAHPLLRSMDEQPFLQNALEDMTAQGAIYPAELARLTAAQLEEIRAAYWRRVSRKVQLEPGQRLIDKNPLNILRLPVIMRLFPEAPVLLAIRHPCDVILSCYMQHFRAPDFALLCADLPGLAAGYRRTFDYWYACAELLRPKCLEVRYEEFVADFAGWMRRIAEFIAIPWDPALLTPAQQARSKRYISTPSYSQVVEPVNQRAVGRWEPYRAHLAPVLAAVQPYLERWHYPS